MNSKIPPLMGITLCCVYTLSAMVIHNDSKKEAGGLRSEPGVFDEDYLFPGRDLRFSGEAEDLVFLGKDLTFSGKTKLGVFAAGQDLSFSGEAGIGIMAACMDMDVTGKIAGNNYLACSIWILATGYPHLY